MKIAIIGYGKMGQAIENIALEHGHTIPLKIDINNVSFFTPENLKNCDVAIEFTGPESAKENILKCILAGVPVVSGSTGWLAGLEEVKSQVKAQNGGFIYASNFSVGVNIFFELNRWLAAQMKDRPEYGVTIEEIHHTAKKDAPSGTAITIAEKIIEFSDILKGWHLAGEEVENSLPITSNRIDPAPGTHIVKYHSEVDDIEIIHTAHSRKGFAAGAVLAAEFLHGKKGIYNMKDVLGL